MTKGCLLRFHSYKMSQTEKSIETKKTRLTGCSDLGWWGKGRERWVVTAEGCGVTFRGDENALKLTVVVITHICEYVKNHELYPSNG